MKTFFLSDHHFGHTNIIRLTKRPFKNVTEMNRYMIDKHNSVVGKNDRVIFGGDFSLCGLSYTIHIFNQLNGKKYIVKGNHDGLNRLRRIGFIDVFKDYWYEDGILVCHYPRKDVPQDLYNECKIFLYGHIHEKVLDPPIPKSKNMCVEHNDYTPFQIL